MTGEVKLVYSISKEAAKLVRTGKAIFSSGGVRGLDGKLIELAQPAVKSIAGNISSPITMLSSLANNVQSGFIQHGVNKANKKLDISLEKLDEIQNAINGLGRTNALGWVNCAFGMANCGISIAGFYMTLSKLDEVSKQIQALSDVIETKIKNDYLERFDRYRMFINADMGRLKKYDLSTQTADIEDHLVKIAAFISNIASQIEKKEISGIFGCSIIFNLAVAFLQEVKEYSAQYYYDNNNNMPDNYEQWTQAASMICTESFKERFKQILLLECLDATMEERYIAYSGAMYGIEYQLGMLEYNKELIHRIERKDYIQLDEFIARQIKEKNYSIINDRLCIAV